MQVLRGDGAEQPYRGRIFLGADGAPITFQVSPGLSLYTRCASGSQDPKSDCHAVRVAIRLTKSERLNRTCLLQGSVSSQGICDLALRSV